MPSTATPMRSLAIVVPVLDDWACTKHLLGELDAQAAGLPPVTVFIVNDGSLTDFGPELTQGTTHLAGVQVIDLHSNLGHQRAICTGLSHVVGLGEFDAIAVMDSDGEDRPQDLPTLVEALAENPDSVVVAQRRHRTEGLKFRAFYRAYKSLFHVLTGQRLDFGNFTVMSATSADRLLHMPEAWNSFPATIMRSRLRVTKVPVDRGARYEGTSRMNFVALVNHGLGAISVFVDVVFVRLLLVFSLAFAISLAVSIVALVVRLTIRTPLPGWLALGASVAVLGLLLVLAVLILATFVQLSDRSTAAPIPAIRSRDYIRSVRAIS